MHSISQRIGNYRNRKFIQDPAAPHFANPALLVDLSILGSLPLDVRIRPPFPPLEPTAEQGNVRIGPIAALPLVLAALGADPRRVFAKAKVKLATFANPENRLPLEAVGRLLAVGEAMSGCDHIGLLLGKRFTLKDLGAVGFLVRNSPTLGEALRDLLSHLQLHDRGAAPVLLQQEPNAILLGYSIYRHGLPATAQIYSGAITIAYRILQELCGPAWKPLSVQFSHRRPVELRAYRALFGPNVRFDAEVSGIVFQSSCLAAPIAGADPVLHQAIAAGVRQAISTGPYTFADQVQCVLHQLVLSGNVSAKHVAGLFGVHERTLRKKLSVEGTGLQQLVDKTRFELAQQLLRNTRLPLSEIASSLHFADLSTFSRAFRGWADTSPSQYRGHS